MRYSDQNLFAEIQKSSYEGQILTKLGTKLSWVKGIQICSNKRSHLFPKGDDRLKQIDDV